MESSNRPSCHFNSTSLTALGMRFTNIGLELVGILSAFSLVKDLLRCRGLLRRIRRSLATMPLG
jgi:hypothetical protein